MVLCVRRDGTRRLNCSCWSYCHPSGVKSIYLSNARKGEGHGSPLHSQGCTCKVSHAMCMNAIS